jgi:hypothetical protein
LCPRLSHSPRPLSHQSETIQQNHLFICMLKNYDIEN